MAEEKQESKSSLAESKFLKTLLLIIAAVLVFAGPTYVVYVLMSILELSYAVSMASGLALFIAGFLLIWYLIRKKAIT